MRRRNNRRDEPFVEIVASSSGLLVQGEPAAVAAYVEQVESVAGASKGRVRRLATDAVQAVANLAALQQAHREYVSLSPQATELLRDNGAIPTGDGYFHSFVRSDNRFAGNLDWKAVDFSPERALALQSAVAQLALRAAIKDVTIAIERVEGKVDKLVALGRSERLGAAIGDNRTLRALREQGRISRTDWSTVDTLGAQIARDIESLRAYLLSETESVSALPLVRSRSGELKGLADEMLKESLALLVVAEKNYVMWHEIKIEHVKAHEPESLDMALVAASARLSEVTEADRLLLGELHTVAQGLLDSTGYEGVTPLERRRLRKHGNEFNELVEWFAEQRNLETVPLVIEYPSLRQSAFTAGSQATQTVKSAGRAIGSGIRLPRRGDK